MDGRHSGWSSTDLLALLFGVENHQWLTVTELAT